MTVPYCICHPWFTFQFPCFKSINIIHNQTKNQRKLKFEPKIKLNPKIYTRMMTQVYDYELHINIILFCLNSLHLKITVNNLPNKDRPSVWIRFSQSFYCKFYIERKWRNKYGDTQSAFKHQEISVLTVEKKKINDQKNWHFFVKHLEINSPVQKFSQGGSIWMVKSLDFDHRKKS